MGDGVTLIDSGATAADFARELLSGQGMLNDENKKRGEYKYFVSDSTEEFAKLGGMFLNCPIDAAVNRVDIEKY